MQNARLDGAQAGIKTARENINNLRYADDMTHVAENEEELKSLLMKVKEESERVGLRESTLRGFPEEYVILHRQLEGKGNAKSSLPPQWYLDCSLEVDH